MIESVINKLERKIISRIPTDSGKFKLYLYKNCSDNKEHIAPVMDEVEEKENVLVRIHSECFAGEVFGSRRCDCRAQLYLAIKKISQEFLGVSICLRREGRDTGLLGKLRAYNLQDQGYNTIDANLLLGHRANGYEYIVAARNLEGSKICSVWLLTNNPNNIEILSNLGINIKEMIKLLSDVNPDNASHLLVKAFHMNHPLQKKVNR